MNTTNKQREGPIEEWPLSGGDQTPMPWTPDDTPKLESYVSPEVAAKWRDRHIVGAGLPNDLLNPLLRTRLYHLQTMGQLFALTRRQVSYIHRYSERRVVQLITYLQRLT